MTTWMIALAGGVLIGLSATLLLWLNGRVAGVSGILNGVLFPKAGDVSWRAMFLLGLIVGYCPGPALAGLGIGSVEALWFIPAMLAGILLHRVVNRA